MKLREVFVKEIRENRDNYDIEYQSDFNYDTEANKFLQNGFYASARGDFMPPALATALQATSPPEAHVFLSI